ncbi:MAG: hypothetical protein ACT6QS_08135 [Flavobacteriales bacterium]
MVNELQAKGYKVNAKKSMLIFGHFFLTISDSTVSVSISAGLEGIKKTTTKTVNVPVYVNAITNDK